MKREKYASQPKIIQRADPLNIVPEVRNEMNDTRKDKFVKVKKKKMTVPGEDGYGDEEPTPVSPNNVQKVNINQRKRMESVMRVRPVVPLDTNQSQPVNNIVDKIWDNYGINDS